MTFPPPQSYADRRRHPRQPIGDELTVASLPAKLVDWSLSGLGIKVMGAVQFSIGQEVDVRVYD